MSDRILTQVEAQRLAEDEQVHHVWPCPMFKARTPIARQPYTRAHGADDRLTLALQWRYEVPEVIGR
jgi:hypothetical protein